MEKLLVIGLLGVSSWLDIKRKEISTIVLVIFGLIGIILLFSKRNLTYLSVFGGILVGIIVLILSYITRGDIGIGDGLILIVTGIFLGGYKNFELLLGALALSAIFSCLLLFINKNMKQEIPFIPFLLIEYLVMGVFK